LSAKPIDVAFRLRMDSITQEDHGRFAARIDPNARPGEPGMAEAAKGEQLASIG